MSDYLDSVADELVLEFQDDAPEVAVLAHAIVEFLYERNHISVPLKEVKEELHVIQLSAGLWTVKHPLSCRNPDLFYCPITVAANTASHIFNHNTGTFYCYLDGNNRLQLGAPCE